MKAKTRLWLRIALTLLLGSGVYLIIRNYEQAFVYAPSPFVTKTPRDAEMAFDNIALVADDGVNIQGWFVPAQSSEPSTNSSSRTLLFFHGKTGNISDCLEKIHLFHDMGLDVFIIDYHGYGKSGGEPGERALTGDALAAYFYLTEQRHLKPERIYLYGQDIGAAVAIGLATKVSAAGLITEGADASVIQKIRDDWPLIPWEYLLRNQFDSLAKIGEVHIPVLLLHSSEDEVVPFNDSRRLFVLAHNPKELVEIHGSHREAFVKSFDTYYDKIEHFVFGPVKDKPTEGSSSTETNAPASKEPTP
jgi:fermentation-respiration switch protein FrsA (DUF1100 family)